MSKPEIPRLLEDCRGIGQILARIGDKWTIMVLTALGDMTMRFMDLHRAIDGISQRMLTVALRHLARDGLLIRTVYPTIPPKVEYTLSPRGATLKDALLPVGNWVMSNRPGIEESRRRFDEDAGPAEF